MHLIHRPAVGEGASKDYEFSRFTMERNWGDGKLDVQKTLSHPDWLNRTRAPGVVVTLDLTKEDQPD